MIAFKQDFVELENQVMALEEKKALADSDNVNVFDPGTTYETEKTKLKNLIDTKVTLYQGLVASFATGYASKNTDFLTTFLQFRSANAEMIKGIQDKISAAQNVVIAFS
ncbi:MAG: hypothetical protein WCJ45_07745 [bacterium]